MYKKKCIVYVYQWHETLATERYEEGGRGRLVATKKKKNNLKKNKKEEWGWLVGRGQVEECWSERAAIVKQPNNVRGQKDRGVSVGAREEDRSKGPGTPGRPLARKLALLGRDAALLLPPLRVLNPCERVVK